MNPDKIADEIMKEIPDGTIPRAYVMELVLENIDCFDTRTEVISETKMQLTEESGMEFLLTREEAEEYMCEDFSDQKWDAISEDGRVSSALLQSMEEQEGRTLFELIKEMPLIPAAKLISSLSLQILSEFGVELNEEQEDQIFMMTIANLTTTLEELDEDPDEDAFDDIDFEDLLDGENPFDGLGVEFDTDEAGSSEGGKTLPDELKIKRGRRSRITRFPGSK